MNKVMELGIRYKRCKQKSADGCQAMPNRTPGHRNFKLQRLGIYEPEKMQSIDCARLEKIQIASAEAGCFILIGKQGSKIVPQVNTEVHKTGAREYT
jgi:hypothetical protein